MYYSDLVSAAETDAADKLYEEEVSNCHTEMKNGVTRSNPQRDHQNLDGASTSSSRNPSLLLDLNTIPPDDISDMVDNQNPNSLLRLDHNTIPADSESAEMTDPPRNLNFHSCRERRAVEDKKPGGKFKKAKVLDTYSWIGREIPESLVRLMNDVNENVRKWRERTDLKLIFQRRLFESDVNPKDGRLSMPFNQLIRNDFLTPVESTVIEEDINNDKKTGIGAIFFDQRNVKWGVMLNRREKEGTWNYALTCGWNDIVKSNGLKVRDDISIWSFRWDGVLCFALVTPPPSLDLCL